MSETQKGPIHSPIHSIGMGLGIVGFVATLLVIGGYFFVPNVVDIMVVKATAVVWAVAPPVYFLLDWHLFHYTDDGFAQFKYSQDCARAVWAGVGAVLVGILLK
jgi:hypothetical protein